MDEYLVSDWVALFVSIVMILLIFDNIRLARNNRSLKKEVRRLEDRYRYAQQVTDAYQRQQEKDKETIIDLKHKLLDLDETQIKSDLFYNIGTLGTLHTTSSQPVGLMSRDISVGVQSACVLLEKKARWALQKQKIMWRKKERWLQNKAIYDFSQWLRREELAPESDWVKAFCKHPIFSEQTYSYFRKVLDNIAMFYAGEMISRWENEIKWEDNFRK